MKKINDGLTRSQRYSLRHPDRRKSSTTRWREKNKDRSAAQRKEYYRQNAEKVRLYNARRWYGITEEQYLALVGEQDNKCAICGVDFSEFKKRPAIDHDHTTGKIRSLLCSGCNVRLGFFETMDPWRQRFESYLSRHKGA